MIIRLAIQDLAIIENLKIEFSPGFNVITGETGAGKSILIRALHLLMGAKASPEVVRQGKDSSIISGEFRVASGHPAVIGLENLGIHCEGDESGATILVRRQVSAKGRTQAWINDVAVTTQALREVGMQLIDVFVQHENQRLMDGSQHLRYVDEFVNDRALAVKVQRLVGETSEEIGKLQELITRYQEAHRNHDYVSFRLDELKKFDPSQADYESVKRLSDSAGKQVEGREYLTKAAALLVDESSGESLSRHLRDVVRLLGQFSKKAGETLSADLSVLSDQAVEIAEKLDELSYAIDKRASEFDIDEGELEAAEKREFGYHDLFRKFGVRDIESLMSEQERMATELSAIETAAEQVAQLLSGLEKKTEALTAAAGELSEKRKTAAKRIKKSIEGELQELSMKGAQIQVEFQPVSRTLPELDLTPFAEKSAKKWTALKTTLAGVSENGNEKAQMLLASNPGEPMLPLNKIASGGELSRILLAFKKALAVDAETCVLVFDEIDTGISGRVADVVGAKLRELADRFQVICISHLAQVAVYADSHLLVEKQKKGARTEANLRKLSSDESAREVARLLSGAEVSTPSLANAKSLIEKARKRGAKPVPASRKSPPREERDRRA